MGGRELPVSLGLTVVFTAALAVLAVVSLTARHPGDGRPVELSQFTVSGDLDVPEHPPGMPYVKAPPMGKFAVTSPDGDNLGSVSVKTLPPPPAPPPTIIRFGDVGVAAAGCPMCPVLDKEAVKKQKEGIKKNEYRIARMKKLLEKNTVKIEEGVEAMKKLKEMMASSIFSVKEAMKKQDITLEADMLREEQLVGPPGPRGPPGQDGKDGLNGDPGEVGIMGRQGKQGKAGLMGVRGPQGPRGPKGPEGDMGAVGPRGEVGPLGRRGHAGTKGPRSKALDCARIGGEMFKGICFKGSLLKADKDLAPEGCKPYAPEKEWGEGDWWKLAQMFHTRDITSRIDKGADGGLCDNHAAVASFTQNRHALKVWVNSQTFHFVPTGSGASCTLHNGDATMAVYACAV